MYDQHVYVLSADDSFSAALAADDVPTSHHTNAKALMEALPAQPRGCIVVDLQLAGAGAFAFLREYGGIEALPVVAMTRSGDVSGSVEAMRHGAVDVIEKPYDNANAIARVRSVLRTEAANWPARRQALSVQHRLNSLTPRETEVLQQLSLGKSNRLTGEALEISPRTVEVHRGRIMGKMGSNSMTSLVRMVVENGLAERFPSLPPMM